MINPTVKNIKKGKRDVWSLENIITIDTETTSGIRTADGVKPFDPEKIEEMIEETRLKTGQRDSPVFDKVSCLYMWQVSREVDVDGEIKTNIGRDSESLSEYLHKLDDELSEQVPKGTIVRLYVHNSGFDFQFFRNSFTFTDVFARSERKPMRARIYASKKSYNGRKKYRMRFMLCDTLALVNKTLENWAKDDELPVQKLDGFDYLKLRTPLTELEEDEVAYAVADVEAMVWGVRKYRDRFDGLHNIPMTQTGIVRRRVREHMIANDYAWCASMSSITRSYSPEFIELLEKAYAGGWTHANAKYVGEIYSDASGYDFASSYPAVMVLNKFPVSSWTFVEPASRERVLKAVIPTVNETWQEFSLLMTVRLYNVDSMYDNSFISYSKVSDEKNVKVDNGRIVSADYIEWTCTDTDYKIAEQAYVWDVMEIETMYIARAGFLSTELVRLLLEAYGDKTKLKDVGGSKYLESKELINSIYGMSVQKILNDVIKFVGEEWSTELPDADSIGDILGKAKPENSPLCYQLGVWVAAWGRYNLWSLILKLDKVVIYGDTDSLKMFKNEKTARIVAEYNEWMETRHAFCAEYHGLDVEMYSPKTPSGKSKPIGIFDFEGDYERFVTLGAKRYAYTELEDGEEVLNIVVAGLPKKSTAFTRIEDFKRDAYISREHSAKNLITYLDDQDPCEWPDGYVSTERYGITLEPTSFSMSMSEEFVSYVAEVRA